MRVLPGVRRAGRGASPLLSRCVRRSSAGGRPTRGEGSAPRRGPEGPPRPLLSARHGLFMGLRASAQGFSLKQEKFSCVFPIFALVSAVTPWPCFSARLSPCFRHPSEGRTGEQEQ